MRESSALLQLRTDEAHQWRHPDDRRVATACYRPLGEELFEAPYAEAAGVVEPNHSGINRAGCLDT